MSKLTDIIRREVKDIVSKQGGLMVTPAVVTAVQEDYLRADVRLMGNGAEIKGMLNKSPGKLTVGQTVTVAYSTLPSSGVILIANGETDPLSEGGGWEVETAAVFDADNVHQWIAQEELMADINANTKLLYGGRQALVALQGYKCQWDTGTAPAISYSDSFGTVIELDNVIYRASSSATPLLCKLKIELFINQLSITSNGVYQYRMSIVHSRYNQATGDLISTSSTSQNVNYAFTDPTDLFIIPRVSRFNFDTTYAGVSTPYGYVVGNQMRFMFGGVDSSSASNVHVISGSSTIYLLGTVESSTYSCVMLGSNAEKCFNVGLTKRSEPTGGDD